MKNKMKKNENVTAHSDSGALIEVKNLVKDFNNGEIKADEGYTDFFIYPGYEFKVLDGLVTNFHLPESTLIMLVSAFMGYKETMHAYEVAVEEKYRFFSFGDAMCII